MGILRAASCRVWSLCVTHVLLIREATRFKLGEDQLLVDLNLKAAYKIKKKLIKQIHFSLSLVIRAVTLRIETKKKKIRWDTNKMSVKVQLQALAAWFNNIPYLVFPRSPTRPHRGTRPWQPGRAPHSGARILIRRYVEQKQNNTLAYDTV